MKFGTVSAMRIVDLSFSIRPHFRWKVAPELVAAHATGHPLQSTVLTISCHAYTHVDAPLHFLPEGHDVATMPIDQWIGDAAVVDLSHLGANGEVSAAELDRRGAHVRRGDIVLLRTDWPRKSSVAFLFITLRKATTRNSSWKVVTSSTRSSCWLSCGDCRAPLRLSG